MNPYDKRQAELKVKLDTYYRSENWATVARLVKTRDKLCQMCFVNTSVHAHHLTYRSVCSLGVTFPVEAVGVCLACHEKIHNKPLDYGR